MILEGPSLGGGRRGRQQASLSLAQLASFNAVNTEPQQNSKKARQNATAKHSKDRETPVSMHVGMTVHIQTHKRGLVDSLFTLGLSISYSRVLEISPDLAG